VTCPTDAKGEWLDYLANDVPGRETAKLTVSRQCELLDVPRTAQYRKHKVPDSEREYNIKGRIDYWHTVIPPSGARQLKKILKNEDCIICSRKLIRKYMAEMGVYAVYPKPNLSKRCKQHKVLPYLLRNMDIFMPNQV
jgi:putative transposase